MSKINAMWQQLSIEIGNSVYRTVNTPEMVGTTDETGYVLMFFNADHHNGKSTLISSCTDKAELRRLLQAALDEIDGPKASVVKQPERAN